MADRYEDRNRGQQYDRDRYQDRDDRGFIERAGDEVRSWFGDEEAQRRREREDRDIDRGRNYGSDRDRQYGRDFPNAWNYGRERSSGGENWGGNRGSEHDWRSGQRSGYGSGGSGYGGGHDRSSGGPYGGSDYTSRMGRDYERSSGYGRDFGSRDFNTSYGNENIGVGSSGYGSSGTGYQPGGSRGSSWDRGMFSGRGPKGYKRSDERIREDICDRLADDPAIDASDIEVNVKDGEVTLSGMVRERDDKRRAEDLVERISGVREVHNSLRTNRGDFGFGGSGSSDTSVLGSGGSTGTSGNLGNTGTSGNLGNTGTQKK